MPFAELAAAYFDFRDDGSRYWDDLRGGFKREVPAALARRSIELLNRTDIRRMLDKTREKSANNERWLFAPLNGMFKWAIERGHMTVNPAADLSRPAPSIKRERVLSENELAVYLKASEGMSYPWTPFYWLLAYTAARRNEVAGMRWEEVDLEHAMWTIPGGPEGRTKNRRTHALELSEGAVRLLETLPRSPSGFVLTTNGRSPISGFSKAKRALDARMTEAGAAEEWHIHDIRRTFATMAAERLAIEEGIIERLLNHVTAQGGVKGVYQRAKYLDARRAAVERWGAYLQKLLDAPA
jgi:integrase